LQARTIVLYLLVAVLYALVLELLVASGWYVFLTHSPAYLKAFQKTGQIPTYLSIVQSVLFTSIIWIILVTPPKPDPWGARDPGAGATGEAAR
jgi:hypothetical protein